MSEKKKELIRAIKFTLFSASAGIIELISFSIMEWLGVYATVAHIIALALSVVWNFTLNRRYTFKSANNVPIAMLKVAVFYALFTPISGFGYDWFIRLGWNAFLAELVWMLINFVLEFLYDRFVVFGSSMDTKETKK